MKHYTLVTGATSGIGFEIAKIYAQRSKNLILVSRNIMELKKVANQIKGDNEIDIILIECDLSKDDSAQKIIDVVESKEIFVSRLINNAGFGDWGPFAESNLEKQLNMIHLNVITLTHLTHYFLKKMQLENHGQIMNVASIASFEPGPLMSVYYATKAYVLSFTEAIKEECEEYDINITALCPGPTKTNFKKAANLGRSGLFSNLKNTTASFVAQKGVKALDINKTIEIPGFLNKLVVFSTRLAPRFLVRKIVKQIQS